MKKILFITPSFSGGGAEKNILNIINQLCDNNIQIHLIVCTNKSDYLNQVNKSIKLHYLNKENVSSALLSIFNTFRVIKPDLVFTSALHLSIPILFYKKIVRAKFIKITRIPTLPSNKLAKKGLKTNIMNHLTRKLLNTSNYIVAQTNQMKDEIVEYYDSDYNKVIVINNIVDTKTILKLSNEEVKLPSGFRYIASGSLYSVKGFDLLIKAFSKHIESYPTDKLLIIGKETVEPGYQKYLEQLISVLNLNNNVFLLGYKSNPYKYYKNSDVFVLSSIKEGYPNVVLENIVIGNPILVTNCIDFTQIVNSNLGLIIDKGSVAALTDGLKEIKSIGKYQIKLENFDFNKWFKEITS